MLLKRQTPIIRKYFTLFGIALTVVIFLTILYISFATNYSYTDVLKFPLYHIEHHNHRPSPRILCLILTSPQYFLTRTKAVHETWGPRCDRHFFITEYPQNNQTSEEFKITKQIPIAPIKNITAGYGHLTQKSTLAFLFAYEKYFNDFDWFVKADDDTYLFVEHLKAFLSEQNSSEPVTFGYNFKITVTKGYHSGGASYVLSRESLRRFYQAHQTPNTTCLKNGGYEDVEIAACLRTTGVYPGKSLDKYNRETFHPLTFIDHFRLKGGWLEGYAENPLQSNYNCCSDQSISFHYVSPDQQYLMDFLLYKTRSVSNIKWNSFKTSVKK